MIGFCKYSFCLGKDTLDPFPTNVSNIKSTKIENGIFDHINITKDIEFTYTKDIPQWDFKTILDCDFEKGTGAGNVEFALSQLTAIRIRRRKKGDFNWITIQEIPIKEEADLTTIKLDYFVPSDEEFEYAIVPILNGVEGQYIIDSIKTKFDGVFICDVNNVFKLNAGVSYGNTTRVQSVGQITPIGRKYPVIIKNGETDYEMGTVSGTILGNYFENNNVIDRKSITTEINKFNEFLTNGKPKIIKDLKFQVTSIVIWMVNMH